MSGLYADRQRQRDGEYRDAYEAWLSGMSPAQRAKVEAMGLGSAVDPDAIDKKHANVDDLDSLRTETAPERSTEFQLALAEAISELCHWFVMPPGQRGLNAKAIGQRVIMAMWVIRPDIIGNLSTTEIGALVDARPEVLSRQATAFSKRFGIRGRSQFSEKTRKAQSDAKRRKNAAAMVEIEASAPRDPSRN